VASSGNHIVATSIVEDIVTCSVSMQAMIKEQLQETNGMCEYAIYVQGEPFPSYRFPSHTRMNGIGIK